MLSAIFTALLLPPLLYLPGMALQRAFHISSPDPLERHFERTMIGALLAGWLALLLSSFGIFSLWLHLAITALMVAGFWWRGTGRDTGRDIGRDTGRDIGRDTGRNAGRSTLRPYKNDGGNRVNRWELAAFAAIGLLALALNARPFEVILGVRDAGVYATTGFAIARTGALVQSDSTLANLGQAAQSDDPALSAPAEQAITNYTISQPRDRYIATRLRAAGFFVNSGEIDQGRIVPQGLHLLPAWIGLLTAIGGPYVGLFAPGLLGIFGAWSVGMLGRRLAGPWVGGLAFLFLALNGVQIWFSRYSTAETTAQFLIWAGLYFFAKMQSPTPGIGDQGSGIGDREHQPSPSNTQHSALSTDHSALSPQSSTPGSHPSSFILHPSLGAAFFAGIAIGQVALARIDAFLLGPAIAYLIYCAVSRRWARPQTFLALGLGLMLLHAGLHIAFIARAYFFDTGFDRLREYALSGLFSLPFLTPEMREVFLNARGSGLASPRRLWLEVAAVAVAVGAMVLLYLRHDLLRRGEAFIAARRTPILRTVFVGLLLLSGYAYFVRPAIIDADMLFNTRGGWSDPLSRDPALVALDVREGRLTLDEARLTAGVVMQPARPYWFAEVDPAATMALRERLRVERGPWQGPFSNQTMNWLRVQGYVGAPIRLPVELWYNEYAAMNWFERLTVDPDSIPSEPAPVNEKYKIPLANLVRVGWYISPLGIILGCIGYALWWRRGLNRASWLFLAVAFFGTFFFVRQTYGTSDQHYIYILRRFVPIAYPALCLGIGYGLVALAVNAKVKMQNAKLIGAAFGGAVALFCSLQFAFLIATNRPIFTHTEYNGAVAQVAAIAEQFTPGEDVVLMRGGAPIYAESRDVPDLLATPLRFAHGIDAFTVKSTTPGTYADPLATQALYWHVAGREVYLALSASGADFALPGFTLEPVSAFALDLPEFEQLTDQKPRNVSRLNLPFTLYRLVPVSPEHIAAPTPPLTPDSFAAQVRGLHRPEQRPDGSSYSWSNGEAILRLPWDTNAAPTTLRLTLAAGERPAHLGPAEVCLSAQPETSVYPTLETPPVDLGCFVVPADPTAISVQLDPPQLPPAPSGSLLLRLSSDSWVPAAEDPRQTDRRSVGIQLGEVTLESSVVRGP